MANPDGAHSVYEPGSPLGSDDDSPLGRTVTASLEEIRYADQLRLQLRESYRRRSVPPPMPWCVGAD